MNIENKKPKIYLICGRARHGKDSFNLIGGKLSNYKKITDMEEK
jgi:hypothetical protein